jgi:uncharacterized membrane protein
MVNSPPNSHTEDTVRKLVELHEAHHRQAPVMQRLANGLTGIIGRPVFVALVGVALIAWIAGNAIASVIGGHAFEQLPFPDLEFAATVAALLVALLIITAQRHDQALADKRAELTLQIAMLSERKIAKLIELVEEQRRDNPLLPNRRDREVEELAVSADPLANLESIAAARAAMTKANEGSSDHQTED